MAGVAVFDSFADLAAAAVFGSPFLVTPRAIFVGACVTAGDCGSAAGVVASATGVLGDDKLWHEA